MLTGHTVFEGTTVFDILSHHLHTEPVPPSKRGGRDVPPDLEGVILKCLRKNPEERPAAAGDLRNKLRQCASARTWTHEDAASLVEDVWHQHGP